LGVELMDFYAEDGVLLNGYISKCNSKKIIISVHGMSSNCLKKRDKVIMEKLYENNISYLSFNNRGSELVRYLTTYDNGKKVKKIGGTSYEDVLDGYLDIKAVIQKVITLGYTDIYMQGHSLGSTKVLYTYNKLKSEKSELLKYIKGIILLSLVDIPRALKVYSKDKFEYYKNYAEKKESNNELLEFMPLESFIHPISVKSYLRYIRDNEDFNFARYSDENYDFKELNYIDIPLFMRWGNVYEMIEQDAIELVNLINSKIKNLNKDINYIDGADHGYNGKEDVLAKQIIEFIKKYDNKYI